MLALFKKGLVNPPEELNSPTPLQSSRKPKLPHEILKSFESSNNSSQNVISLGFGDAAVLAYIPPQISSYPIHQRYFCGVSDMYCIFMGSLSNLCSLNRQYGLSKGSNEAVFAIEAYRTLRDRGPYPAHQVLRDLEGSFGFVIFDSTSSHVFAALGAEDGVKLYWGVGADGSAVISDDLGVIKESCGKSYAPFPAGCMFHSEQGLVSFEHPSSELKPLPRIDSEGVMCGANFKADCQSKVGARAMPRVGSEVNWALSGSMA